jgi:hypothetical protein
MTFTGHPYFLFISKFSKNMRDKLYRRSVTVSAETLMLAKVQWTKKC